MKIDPFPWSAPLEDMRLKAAVSPGPSGPARHPCGFGYYERRQNRIPAVDRAPDTIPGARL